MDYGALDKVRLSDFCRGDALDNSIFIAGQMSRFYAATPSISALHALFLQRRGMRKGLRALLPPCRIEMSYTASQDER